jgi:uncharacterized protein (TIGR02996 family)
MTTEDQLIAHIAEDPQSDGPRLVLADYYVQQGDPRGELMAIQLATQPLGRHQRQLQRLLREQRVRMAGGLADVLDPRSIQIRRGRLSSCRTRFRTNADRTAARGNPLWATVEELDTDDAALVADPMMRSLRSLRGLGLDAFAAVCRGDRALATIEEVRVSIGTQSAGSREDRAAIGNTSCLPNLRRFAFELRAWREPVSAERLEWFLASPLGQQLDRVVVMGDLLRMEVDDASFAAFRARYPRPPQIWFNP